jgi:hypothetical protein
MAATSEPPESGPQPSGSNIDLIRELLKNPVHGFFFLIVIVAEGGLFLTFLRTQSDPVRYAALGAFVVLMLAAMAFFAVERHRFYALERERLAAAAVPRNLVAEPIGAEAVERAADIMTSPDGTFVYSRPPENWRVVITTIEDDILQLLREQGLAQPESVHVLPFRAGPLVRFDESHSRRIGYLPGRSMMNGRPAIGAFNERLREQLRMYSVSKHGGMIREMTAEHVFSVVLSSLVQFGSRAVEIRAAPSGVDRRATLTARCVTTVENVLIDDQEVASAAIEALLHVVEYANFVYVIHCIHVAGAPNSAARAGEANSIVASFRAAAAANAAQREAVDREEADRFYDLVTGEQAPGVLHAKARELCRQMSTSGGVPRVDERRLEEVTLLARYAEAFPNYIPEDLREALLGLEAAAKAAFGGNPEPLAAILAESESASFEPTAPTPAALPPASDSNRPSAEAP